MIILESQSENLLLALTQKRSAVLRVSSFLKHLLNIRKKLCFLWFERVIIPGISKRNIGIRMLI